jgi:hypothetical protein
VNDPGQAVPGASMGARCRDDPEPPVTSYLPDPRLRCSALWYAQRAGLLTGGGDDLDFLRELGYQAACRARWEGIPEWRVREGPFTVNMWPEKYFSWAADVLAQAAAEHGDWHLRRPDPPSAAISPGHGYWEPGDYGPYDAGWPPMSSEDT